jgi:probable F420-dependent oxidoreductase
LKIGVCSANSGPYSTREMLVLITRLAESAGIESIWVSEHLVVSDPRIPPSPMDPEDPILDAVTTLAFLAGRTHSVRLGSSVIVLPLHNPLVLAKELATVDVLSGGRLILGVGVGYVEREFRAIGVSFEERGRRLEDQLAAIRAIWTQEHPRYDGPTLSFDGVQAHPHPLQRPHPPIVMGGYAPAVMRRTIREADGWYGWGLDLEATARRLETLRQTATRIPRGEGLGPLEVTITPPEKVDVATAERYADLGVHRLNLMLPWDAAESALSRFFERVIAPLMVLQLER